MGKNAAYQFLISLIQLLVMALIVMLVALMY